MIIGNISANDLYQYNKVNTVRPEITVAKPEQSPNSINTPIFLLYCGVVVLYCDIILWYYPNFKPYT